MSPSFQHKTILIIDHDPILTTLLTEHLHIESFLVQSATNGEDGLKIALNQSIDAIILDVILPKLSGFDVLESLREHRSTPALFLTSREDDIDRFMGFNLGADDYLQKPCDPYELIARLKRIILRTPQTSAPLERSLLSSHDLHVDCKKRVATRLGQPLELTNTEFNILEVLIKSPAHAFSKQELTKYALGKAFSAYDRSIDVHIGHLRAKLGIHPNGTSWIKTVRGFGYQFNE